MLTLVKWTVRVCAAIVLWAISIGLRVLMPAHSLALAWITFIGLWMCFSFALVLLLVSVTMGFKTPKPQPATGVSHQERTENCYVFGCEYPVVEGSAFCAEHFSLQQQHNTSRPGTGT